MNFTKYQHIERLGTDEVEGIEIGVTYVFPKIDGTNGVVWWDNEIKAGSRNRELTLEKDNAGFYAWVLQQENLKKFFCSYPNAILYGEWLVPHTLKTYRDDAWKKFYVFDMYYETEAIHYKAYQPVLEKFNIDYIPLLAKVENGSYEQYISLLDKNNYLIKDGQGVGEGIVIKNYAYKNKYGRQTWAKIVRNEFKEKHRVEMGVNVVEGNLLEEDIVNEFCTKELIDKEYSKIANEKGWRSEYIPMLLGIVYHTLIQEEVWNFIKKHKYPTINFKTLNFLTIQKIKQTKPELF